jgi:hypothetical protein
LNRLQHCCTTQWGPQIFCFVFYAFRSGSSVEVIHEVAQDFGIIQVR